MSRPGPRQAAWALLVLTTDAFRRLLRQGLVVRSLVFPGAIATFTLFATVLVFTSMQVPGRVALTSAMASEALVARVQAAGFDVDVVDDPAAWVAADRAALGTDGATLWIGAGAAPPLPLEAIIREELDTVWRPHLTTGARKARIQDKNAARPLAVLIGALFSMYGVVFSAGGVARDRSEGTLDAELAMAVPHVVHGMARWLSSTLILTLFYGFSVFLLNAAFGVDGPGAYTLHGGAACGIAAAIGLVVVGRSGLDKGFAGIMAAGLFSWMSLVGLGMTFASVGRYLPGVSLYIEDASPGLPVLFATLAGLAASVVFSRRTAVQ